MREKHVNAPVISLDALWAALDRLTGDAVKLGVLLVCDPVSRADAAWIRNAAHTLGMGEKIVRKIVKELADEGLIELTGRVNLAPVSDAGHSLARQDSQVLRGPTVGGEEDPPWERQPREPQRGEAKEGEGSGNGEVCPQAGTEPRDDAKTDPPSSKLLLLNGKEVSPHKFVVENIDRMYRDCYSLPGAPPERQTKPTWGAKQGNAVKTLLKQHSAEEIVRRATVMFYEKRSFPKPPYDVMTLVAHFDKFIGGGNGGGAGGMVGDRRRTGEAYYGRISEELDGTR